jgi:hypothetical protein
LDWKWRTYVEVEDELKMNLSWLERRELNDDGQIAAAVWN